MSKNFLDNFIHDRIRIQKEDKNPIHPLEVINKHWNVDINSLITDYKVDIQVIRCEITFNSNRLSIYRLYEFFLSKNLELKSITDYTIVVDIDQFYKLIY